ncbi:MAG: GLPGLI family protein [Bernardetiaceae bacterium]
MKRHFIIYGFVCLLLSFNTFGQAATQKAQGTLLYTFDLINKERKAENQQQNARRAAEQGVSQGAIDRIKLFNPYQIVYQVLFRNGYFLQRVDKSWQNSSGMRRSGSHLERSFYTDLSQQKQVMVEGSGEKKAEKLPVFDWKIHKETKKLGNFICQKATTSSEGKTVTAWFARAIPVSGGPAGYWGLPGFILELYTGDGYAYLFTDYNSELPTGINLRMP